MFEAHVLHLLRKYLGEYVHGLSAEALRISVWNGDVVLKDLKLKAEALNLLKLPVTVKAGFVGTITLKVPWKSLGKEPVIVLVDSVFILANPAPNGWTLKEEDREKLFEAKLQQIEEAESVTLEAKARSKQGNVGIKYIPLVGVATDDLITFKKDSYKPMPPIGNSWLGSLIATVIGNLKISISNVHIRYEDSLSNPGYPFSSGITLAKLAAVTMDEQGNETFDASGALDKLRKSLQLERLAIYHDSNKPPWNIDKNWEDLSSGEWIEIFGDGINEPSSDRGMVSAWASNREYLISPINGVLKYHRLGNQEREEPEIPLERASLVVSDVSLMITEAQYRDVIKLMEVISRYKTHVDVCHLRPFVSVSKDPHVWWRYAAQASLQRKEMCYRFSWDRIRHLCQLRRCYIQLYAASLQQLSNIDYSEMRDIEKDLDSKVILLWRLLAHAKVESVRSKEAAQRRSQMKRSWFSFGWGNSSEDISDANPEGSQLIEERLTKEEWQAINKLLSYQPDEELAFHSGRDMQNIIRFLVNVSIGRVAARVIDINQTEIICGRFEELQVTTKLYSQSTTFDVSLRFYGLYAPEGSLAQSFSSEKKVNALAASFVHSPVQENVDWLLSAKIAPCHVTVLMESCDRLLEFLRRSNAVSPTVALETATALQMKLEKVTRRAQEQFQMVLEEQSRFSLDIDFDAPKVRVPLRTRSSTECDGHFVLDFGHFTLHTKDGQCDEQRQSLYSRFYISGQDIAAFFTDCGPDHGKCTLVNSTVCSQPSGLPTSEDIDHFLPLLDRCGMAVIVDQIKVPHPSYPSTRLSIQVPNLCIHFSPARYCRILGLLNIVYSTVENRGKNTSENFQIGEAPWSPADLACKAKILVWRGIGNSVAEWQPCFVVLSGLYLYILESEASQSYQRCASMSGRQVYEVPPTSIGGSTFSIALSFRGMDTLKALESSSTLIIEFQDKEEKATWLRGLTRATYRASAPPSVDVLEETSDGANEHEPQSTNFKAADLVINGTLVETKLLIYGKTGDKLTEQINEKLIIEIVADGGKVHLIHWDGDLMVKTKLHSLKIKDELQSCLSTSPHYLARSVLKDDIIASPSEDVNEKELSMVFLEEDDIFKDALPDFSSILNPVFCSGTKLSTLDVSEPREGVDSIEASMQETTAKRKGVIGEMFYEAEGNGTSDFVVVTFSTIDPGSPVYDGIDMQMSIRMSKLEFFCNRPALVALIGFVLDLSSAGSAVSYTEENDVPRVEPSHYREKAEESSQSFVKGLLGYGKGRVVFYLNMDVDSVFVFLNKEDGSQLAMFVQESFLLDLKVHPSSLSIVGTLGSFRLCDMSLGADHQWGWLCDIRNQGVESLIKFTFNSYSTEDDDYEGYDYSLHGRLSAVRIVLLYRFVQEITSYFMELATPHSEEAIKLVDKVGGFEWLIHKYEIDGSSALKLDLSLDTPIIIIPKDSKSKDFLQLELGHLQLRNEFSWHGCPDNDPSAVHLDVLHAEIVGINMAVGVNGQLGKPMIREAQCLNVYVRRSLRDVFRKVPTFSVEVKVGSLHCVMSDKEYSVILDCAYMNIDEEPKLPPSFRSNITDPNDTIRMLADKVNINSQIFLSRTVTVIAIEVNSALLELCSGIDEESPLAHIALEGLWVSYRMTSLSETDIYINISIFSIVDIRPDTRPEMRLMLGSSSDVSRQFPTKNLPVSLCKSESVRMDSDVASDMDFPNSTMLLMDYRLRSSSQSFMVRVQQPRVLVVLDFLLAVGEFFVPALGAITGREEVLDPKNDPITKKNSILLSSPTYKQREDVVCLSPNRQLIADARGVVEYIYDGCGGTICLSEEIDLKETSSFRFLPIIVVGRGKKLRFMNVKIENAALLRKYVYLSNDSSYSVSVEDGVDLLFLDSFSFDNERKRMDHLHKSIESSSAPVAHNINDLSKMESFTFEAQVLSPEFTFYDSTKSFLDDSLHGEKLLRAKMDLSFIYASTESETWIRALVKDLTVEAGSGLIILDPVDISGGYTSVKEKTNISVILTDVCFHLSLSVISLVVNLQNQAAAALHFRNADPLASCTNFDRLWVSAKGNGPGYNLTFWRPRAPSNYVILGDCVTSRPIPPSQAVMAVGNTYGRVRKPLGFKLIGLFSDIYGLEGDGAQSDDVGNCSLWLPIAPPGYSAVGCVAHVGNKPPPLHIVYCIRSDLVTSTVYSDCILGIPSNPRFSSGFSIWRLDNVVGSFCAHPAEECPSNSGCDLAHILLRNSNWFCSSSENSASDGTHNKDYGGQQGSKESASSSGWDILRSISKASGCYMSTSHFERIWWDKGSDLHRAFSVWRPIPRPGYAILGDCITVGLEPPALGIIFKDDNPEISAKPVQFTKVSHIVRKGLDEAFFWYPIAPPGYASLGCVVSRTDEPPHINSFCCPRMDLVYQTSILELPISTSSSSGGSYCWSIWKVENQACTFLARSDLKKPSSRLAYTIGDSVKPKTQENISGEIKLRCFSLTVVDSLCGMMTPLFDTTITNINLATHGRLEAMNAVLVSSIAASTFNTQLEAWEPLVEPFDGIFKFETYNNSLDRTSRVGKRMHVATTNIINVNISAANVETFEETIISWKRQAELQQKYVKLNEDAGSHLRHKEDSAFSALDEDVQTMVIENRLGCDIYLKKVYQNSETIELLHHGDSTSAWMPPPRFSDRLNVADESREARFFVAVQIYEGLPIVDDGNSHIFFCALRLVVDSLANDQHKLFPQSARTKCVKPSISKGSDLDAGTAKWNELFIFEVPRKGQATLEVEVTNLAAKAGKGEVFGASSIPVGHGVNTLKKVASMRMLHQSSDGQKLASFPLTRMGQLSTDEGISGYGCLFVSTCFFERKTVANLHWEMESVNETDRDSGFCLSLGPEGPWDSLQSLLPVSVTPKILQEDFIALQVVMNNAKKHAIFRGLATVVNDSDVNLDLSVCPNSMLHNPPVSASEPSCYTLVEEIFENQYYHSISGWGNKWPGFHGNDPGRWSTRDFSYSSKDFFEPPLPPGWKWASTWTIEKSLSVDPDGWAYGPDYQSIKWPPASPNSCKKSAKDNVRRRRWIRTRQQLIDKTVDSLKNGIAVISPGSSTVLPWRSMAKDSDLCLEARPFVEYPQSPYSWGNAVAVGSGYAHENDQSFVGQSSLSRQNTMNLGNTNPVSTFRLNQLEKKDILWCCSPSNNSKQYFWLSIGTDASVLHTELNAPVYDWKISITSPFKLENRLPCPAKFTIWERTKEGNSVERQHGIITSRKSVHIYSVDIRKPIYLSLFVQGGWVLEKDPVLILNLSSLDHVSSFWMVHQQSNRRLRVSIEHDMGGTGAAPKTIRFFVPYWISNDSSLPLAYRVVEVETTDNTETDSLFLSRAVKSAKMALKNPINLNESRNPGTRRNIQILEVIEDTSPTPVMLSPQNYVTRGGVLPFQSRNDAYLSPRVGVAVAIRHSEHYTPGIPLLELEKKERVDVKAFASDGSYFKLSALLNVTSDRTKVVHFQPHTVFINRVGQSLALLQCGTQSVELIHPNDPPKQFQWQSMENVELLKMRVKGYKWSTPFSIGSEGVMCVSMKNDSGSDHMYARVEVRTGTKHSRYEVVFRPASFSSPYRIENRSMFFPIRFRQVSGTSDSWCCLPPNSAASFLWEDLGRQRLLEVMVDGADPSKSEKYNIDEVADHQPIHVSGGPTSTLYVTVLKEEKINVVKISDWMPENGLPAAMPRRSPSSLSHMSLNDLQDQQSQADCEFHVIVELAELGLSIIDHTPEEILYLSVQNLLLSHSTGLGSGISRFKLRMHAIQVDNQLSLTPMPVILRPQRVGEQIDYILKLSLTSQSNESLDLRIYPYIGFQQGAENSAFLINIHEPIIWRLHEMIQRINLNRLRDCQTTAISVDPIIQIGVLNISEIRFKVSMAMSPMQRPRGVLGFWLSLMTALGNTENMQVRINQRLREDVSMRQSAVISSSISNVQKDLLSQPLQLLSGIDILGNASSALGNMSKGVAALSMDNKFIKSRQRQESKGVEDIGDVIREGGGALAKGLFRGVTGILTKPLEGAKSSGVEGFVQGVGKGIIGAAAQPVSGVLDLLSKTTEGANAMRMKIASAITSEEQLLRRRLPRVISGDNLLRPYDEYRAQGQVILQLAESGAFFGQVDLFKVRGKFALSDAYEDHFLLPEGKIFVVTHRRVILLQQPYNVMAQRTFSPARDPCSVLWDVLWDDLMTVEMTHGKKDHPSSPPSQLILYLQTKSMELKDHTRVIKCSYETRQALEIYSSIEQAMNAYGPNHSRAMKKNKVTKPYSPSTHGTSDVLLKEGARLWSSPQQAPAFISLRSTFGSSAT